MRIRSEWPGTPGRSVQRPRTTSSIVTPGPRGAVEGLDHLGILEPVELGADPGRASGPRVLGLPLDPLEQPWQEALRGHRDPAERARGPAARAGELIEQIVHVGAEVGIGGEADRESV